MKLKIADISSLKGLKIWNKSKKQSEAQPVAYVEFWEQPFDDKKAVAKQIVGHSVLVRKSEQSLNPESLLWVFLLVAMVWFYASRVQARIDRGNQRAAAKATLIAGGSNPYDIGGLADLVVGGTPTPSLEPIEQVRRTMTAIAAFTPTPVPTDTPIPTQITMQAEPVLLKLSFYDPDIARHFKGTEMYNTLATTNCANYDFANDACASYTVSGSDFRQWYGRGVACPPPMHIGDWLRVEFPEQLRGDWVCIDRGGAIQNGYVDFLLQYPDDIWTGYNLNDFPWSSTVQGYWVHP